MQLTIVNTRGENNLDDRMSHMTASSLKIYPVLIKKHNGIIFYHWDKLWYQ